MQGASNNKPQGLMTPCTPSGSGVANWFFRLNALEWMMAQVVAIVSRSNVLVTPPMEVVSQP
jgi:hypothetical protein